MKARSLIAFAAWLLCAGPSAGATVSSIPVPIPETYIQHDVSLQGANGQLGVNGTVTARLDTANTWALTQTFTLAPVFTDQPGTRTALGLVIGTNVEAWDADLDALAALSSTAGILKRTGAGAFGLAVSGTDYAPATSGSAAQLGNGAGGFSAYTGTVCTGQFVRSLSAAIVATCNAVSLTADVTGVLPIANGGCNASTVAGCLTNLGVAPQNLLANPSFDVWQENTTYSQNTGVNTFMADRWKARTFTTATNGTRTYSRVAGFSGAQYAVKMQRTNGNAETGSATIGQQILSSDAITLAGKTIHLACDASFGANASNSAMTAVLFYGTGIDEVVNLSTGFATGAGNSNFSSSPTVTASTTSHVDFGTVSVNAGETEAAVRISSGTYSGTAGADDSISLTNCNLTVGSGDVPFAHPPLVETMARAQFTYRKSFVYATVPAQNVGTGTGEFKWGAEIAGTVTERATVVFGSAMFAPPTVTLYNPAAANGACRDETVPGDGGTAAAGNITEKGFEVTCTGNASTAVGNPIAVHYVADIRR